MQTSTPISGMLSLDTFDFWFFWDALVLVRLPLRSQKWELEGGELYGMECVYVERSIIVTSLEHLEPCICTSVGTRNEYNLVIV